VHRELDLKTLGDLLLAPHRRHAIVADCVKHLEAHVARRPGLRGVALRAGFATVKAIRADIAPKVVERLLPDSLAALEPLYQRFQSGRERDFNRFLRAHLDEATGAVLEVTARRARTAGNAALKTAYSRLRGLIATELEEFLPGLGAALSTHLVE